jgi:hypothetical protein
MATAIRRAPLARHQTSAAAIGTNAWRHCDSVPKNKLDMMIVRLQNARRETPPL